MQFNISSVSQNLLDYLPPQPLLLEHLLQKNLKSNYLSKYFSPWTEGNTTLSHVDIKQMLLTEMAHHQDHPGYALTRKRYESDWIRQIIDNADLDHFPNLSQPGIILSDIESRLLPTHTPSFKDIHSPWHGYPIDDMQQSYLTSGMPVWVLHLTKDHTWILILTASFFAWVPNKCVGFVTPIFIRTYHTKHFVVSSQDRIYTFKTLAELPLPLRIGSIYPIKAETADQFLVYVPTVNHDRSATLISRSIDKTFLDTFPETITYKKIAEIANRMMGNPYGWGGMCGFRDCSSTLADLMSCFGIWLPRNSKDQIQAGDAIDLKNMNSEEKLSVIRKTSIPFLTLLYAPGHIVLYLGQKNGIDYVYHSTFRLYGTVITPLDVRLKEERPQSLLEEIEQIRVLV